MNAKFNVDKIYSLVKASKAIEDTFLHRIPSIMHDEKYLNVCNSFKYDTLYKSMNDRHINEVLIRPIKFTSTSILKSIPAEMDAIWITNETNEFIGEYFLKYINEHKNDIWKYISEEIKKDAIKQKETFLKEIDKLKNEVLNI